ncbi:MAG: hypothetical protein ACRCX2_33840 [Paraclostridium sp.]
MAWYNGTFACGCEGRVNIIGPGKDREWKKERSFNNLCSNCYKEKLEQERELKNAEALALAEEMELPQLTGTEKQVAWANTLRNGFIEKLSDAIEDVKGENKYRKIRDLVRLFGIKKGDYSTTEETIDAIVENMYKFEEIFISKTKASYFIDKRYYDILDLIEEEVDNILITEDDVIKAEEIIKETTIEPIQVEFNGVVKISCNEDIIKVSYEKNDAFIEIVKGLGYRWRNGWERKIGELTGSYIDRAAEVANKLLVAGFRVAIPDIEIRDKALSGTYEAECNRWILRRKDSDKLAIKWYEGRNNSLYDASRKLSGASWDNGATVVNVAHYKQVKEFAEMYGFKFSKSALELINQYALEIVNVEKVEVKEAAVTVAKNGLEDILNSSRDILDDLIEED